MRFNKLLFFYKSFIFLTVCPILNPSSAHFFRASFLLFSKPCIILTYSCPTLHVYFDVGSTIQAIYYNNKIYCLYLWINLKTHIKLSYQTKDLITLSSGDKPTARILIVQAVYGYTLNKLQQF